MPSLSGSSPGSGTRIRFQTEFADGEIQGLLSRKSLFFRLVFAEWSELVNLCTNLSEIPQQFATRREDSCG